jgi:hypothetical protein
MTMSSRGKSVCRKMERSVFSMNGAWLYDGTTTETVGSPFASGASGVLAGAFNIRSLY